MTAEQWRPIPGYEGIYEVSDQGNVRGLDRISTRGYKVRGRMLRPTQKQESGYFVVSLWWANRQRLAYVHRLVLEAFVGPAPIGTECLHRDGRPSNNALGNLTWGTHAENQADQVAHGTHPQAAKTHCPSGHPYDAANTYLYPGQRKCRTCHAGRPSRRKQAA